jgi:hypothetical protein
MVLPGEVDMLLTCEWPAGVLQQLPTGTASPEGEWGWLLLAWLGMCYDAGAVTVVQRVSGLQECCSSCHLAQPRPRVS